MKGVRLSIVCSLAVPLVFAFCGATSKASQTHPVLQGAPVYNFENKLAHWNCNSHTFKEKGFKAGIDTANSYQGSPSAFIKSILSNQDDSFYVRYWQSFKADKFLNKQIEFTGYVKTKDLKGSAGLWMMVNEDETVTAFDNLNSRPINENSQWQKISILLPVPEKSSKITIGMFMRGSGEVWFSKLGFSEASSGAKSTSIVWDPKKYSIFKNELNTRPVNLDFSAVAEERGPLQVLQWKCHTPGESYKIFVDRQTKLNDKASACIEAKSDAPSFASLYQDFSSQNYKGKKVKFSGFVKTKDVSDWSGIWMRVDDATQVLAFDNMENRRITGTNDWKKYDVVLEVPQVCKKIKVGVMQAGKGTSWFNNCHFEPVDATVTTTGKPIVVKEPVNDALPAAPDLELKSR
jgi:uncharacterized protein YfbU (UPF0304 family)